MTFLQRNPILGSSANPDAVSMTIKSIGAWIVVGLIALAKVYELNLVEADLTEVVNTIAVLAGGVMTLYGLGRKIYFRVKGTKYAK